MERHQPISEKELRRRLELYQDPKITDELQRVAGIMLEEVRARWNQMDTKANAMVGFAGVILALLVNLATKQASLPLGVRWALMISGMSAVTAGVLGILAVRVTDVAWLNDEAWFDRAALEMDANQGETRGSGEKSTAVESLRRQFLVQSHNVVVDHNRANGRKADLIVWSQIALLVSTFTLLCALVLALWPVLG